MLHQSAIWFNQLVGVGGDMPRRRWLASLKNAARVDIDCTIPRFSFSPRASAMPQALATSLTKASDFCVGS
jgi:hypothetical protein